MSFLTKMQFMFENLFNRVTRMIPSASGKILYNKWILYFIFVVGIYDVVHFYQRGNIMAVAIFVIVGFLTSFFSKNMIVVIVSAIAVSHIVAYGNKMTEGLDEKEGLDEEEEDEKEGMEEDEEEGFAEGEKNINNEEKDDEEKDNEEKPKNKKSTNDEGDTFQANIEKMQTLLNQTETLVKESKQQGFHTMKSSYAEYK
jgi:low affinity Fe/Cu permease